MKNGEKDVFPTQKDDCIETKVRVERKMFYDKESLFGIYAVKPLKRDSRLCINSYNNVTAQGYSQELIAGEEYELKLSLQKEPKKKGYSNYHEILKVVVEELKTTEEHFAYLQSLTTENQYRAFEMAYPNTFIIELIKQDSVDCDRLVNIGQKTLNKIKEKILSNVDMAELISELSKLKIHPSRVKKISEHFGSPHVALNNIRKSIYCITEVSGFGFKTVDEYALKSGMKKDDPKRLTAAFKFVLKTAGESEGHSWLNSETLIDRTNELIALDSVKVSSHLNDSMKEDVVLMEEKVSLKRYYQNELDVFENLNRLKETYEKPNELSSELNEAIQDAEISLGITYTEEQREAITNAFNEGVYILNGGGGVGKTTVLKGIVNVWKSLNNTYHGCALSGKAANVMQQNGIKSSTIHRLLKLQSSTRHDENNPLEENMIILDEASMVNADIFAKLTKAISDGSMLIIVGDSGQLSGIGHGDILRDLLSTNAFNKTVLSKIHRQAADSGIIELATRFRTGVSDMHYNQNNYKTSYGVNNDMINYGFKDSYDVLSATKKIINSLSSVVKTDEDLMNFQILTATKKPRKTEGINTKDLNDYAQSVLNSGKRNSITRGNYTYKEGDKVIAVGNTYEVQTHSPFNLEPKDKVDLYNGTMGIIKKINMDSKLVYINFEGIENLVLLEYKNLDAIDMGYAITIHRSQGSSIPNVIGAFDSAAYSLLSRQLAYTLITRASKKCVLVTQNNSLHKALNVDASGSRNTLLKFFIEGEIDTFIKQN